jgi:hypothetical protein
MKTVEISLENARTAYKQASGDIKEALVNLIGRKVLFEDITEVVKSYEDACEIEGIFPLNIDAFSFLPEQDREYHFYDHQMTVINRVLNEGWEPDYSNSKQYKYYPYFVWDENRAGGPGFSYFAYYFGRSASRVGARRVYKNEKLAIYSGKQFLEIHNKIHSLKR